MRLWLAHLIFLPLAVWALITVFDYRAASNEGHVVRVPVER